MNRQQPAKMARSVKTPDQQILLLAALGVVYGDIGTSPLYAFRECFYGGHATTATPAISVLSAVEGLELASPSFDR